MKALHRLSMAATLAAFFIAPAHAQNGGTVTSHAFAIGKGPGVQGYTSLLCGSAQLAVGQAAADPICQTITGDVTISAGGVTAIGANKVTNAQFRQSGALSLVGRSANSTGNVADISAVASSSCVFMENASSLTCANIGTANVSNSAITYAKIQNVTASRLLGNPTGSAAAPSEISLGSTLTFSGSALQTLAFTGDVTSAANSFAITIAANAVTNAKMATMAANTVKANATGSAATPTDVAPATARSSSLLNIDSFTGHGDSNFTLAATDRTVGTNAAFTASRTWTLPAASAVNPGQETIVADFQGTVTGTNTLVIQRAGSDTINGGTSVTISAANGGFLFRSDGVSKWTAQSFTAGTGITSVTCFGVTITTSGTCTTAGQLPGTATNDNASAGNVGEFVKSSVVQGSAVSLTSGALTNITSMSLTAGDWDVQATCVTNPSSATQTTVDCGVNTTSATLPDPAVDGGRNLVQGISTSSPVVSATNARRFSLASTTTVFMVMTVSFSGGTNGGYGTIRARRMR